LKKLFKKFSMVLAAVILGLSSFAFMDNGKAHAYYAGCSKRFHVPNGWQPNLYHTICVSEDASNVYVTIQQDKAYYAEVRINWKMELQRATKDAWITVGTRYGWVSHLSPSHRTFTNVLRPGEHMRVLVTFYHEDGSIAKIASSPIWIR